MNISTGVWAVELALLGLFAFSAYCALRALARRMGASGAGRLWLALAGCGAGMLTLGCRLAIAEGQVSWAPYADQWTSEISGVVAPLVHGTLGWRDLFAGNNEHRVVLSRGLSVAFILANGGWDNRALVIGSYLLESLMLAWVCTLALSTLGWARAAYVCAAALLPMLLVCDWETLVSGNQTPVVLLSLGSVVALSLEQGYSLRSVGSWGALALSVLMLGTMASGFLTAVALMATGAVAALAHRRGAASAAGFGAACLGIAALGWFTRVRFDALHFLYAKGPADWMRAFFAYAAWPLAPGALGFLLLWLPWFILLYRMLRFREAPPMAPFAFGLGLWVMLQSCALAWTRSGFSGLVSSRYTEFLVWGTVANAAAMVLIFRGPVSSGSRRAPSLVAMAIWLALVGGSEAWRSRTVYRPYFDSFRAQTVEHEQRLGTFMRTGDAAVLEGVSSPRIPMYSGERLVSILEDPQVVAQLPAPMRRDQVRDRQPLLLAAEQDGPLCFAAIRLEGWGRGIAAAGLALIAGSFLLYRRVGPAARAPRP